MTDTTIVDLQKDTPGSGLGYVWEKAGDIVTVAAEHVLPLITASHGDIHRVPDDYVYAVEEPEAPAEDFEKPTRRTKAGR